MRCHKPLKSISFTSTTSSTLKHFKKILHHLLHSICEDPQPQTHDAQVGGLAERPLSGAVVGPTFGCLLGQQFQILKKGDRWNLYLVKVSIPFMSQILVREQHSPVRFHQRCVPSAPHVHH